jgi:two-component system sensor histidine kinase BaeS
VHRLAQLFTNLLENSLRYTDAGGRLHLQFDAVGTEVRVRFDDTAPGVQPELLPRLFERFFRAEPSRARAHGGSGLGLSICQRIVVAHGGRMEASASPLGGLRMEVYLPGGET